MTDNVFSSLFLILNMVQHPLSFINLMLSSIQISGGCKTPDDFFHRTQIFLYLKTKSEKPGSIGGCHTKIGNVSVVYKLSQNVFSSFY